MSRTDKDMPDWVRATLYQPVHVLCDNDVERWAAWRPRWRGVYRSCDLPAVPRRGSWRYVRQSNGAGPHARCHWRADDTSVPGRWIGWNYYRHRGAPRGFRHREFHDPVRAYVRDRLRQAAAEYRGSGEADIEPEPRQNRGTCRYDFY